MADIFSANSCSLLTRLSLAITIATITAIHFRSLLAIDYNAAILIRHANIGHCITHCCIHIATLATDAIIIGAIDYFDGHYFDCFRTFR